MIKTVKIQGKDVLVRYESEVLKIYRKPEDINKTEKGVQPLPKTVINFMRNHPEKVR